jgi:hypothetical protein
MLFAVPEDACEDGGSTDADHYLGQVLLCDGCLDKRVSAGTGYPELPEQSAPVAAERVPGVASYRDGCPLAHRAGSREGLSRLPHRARWAVARPRAPKRSVRSRWGPEVSRPDRWEPIGKGALS